MSSGSHEWGWKLKLTANATSTGASAIAVRRVVVDVNELRLAEAACSGPRSRGSAGTLYPTRRMRTADATSATSTMTIAATDGMGADGSTKIRTTVIITAPIPTIALTIWIGRRADSGRCDSRLMNAEHRDRGRAFSPEPREG
jgi:hypothetical protein